MSSAFAQDRARRSKVGHRVAVITVFDDVILGSVVRNGPDYIVIRDEDESGRQLAVTHDCVWSFRMRVMVEPKQPRQLPQGE